MTHTKKTSRTEERVRLYALSAIVVIGISFAILYFGNYHLSGYRLIKGGTLVIENIPTETFIYIDKFQKSSGGSKDKFIKNLSAGSHNVAVAKVGYWPYFKDIEIKSGDTYKLNFFVVPQSASGVYIDVQDPKYQEIKNLFGKNILPSEESPLVSDDGLVAISIKDNKIFANWLGDQNEKPYYFCFPESLEDCTKTSIVSFDPITTIRNVTFYKGRNDSLLIAVLNGVFVLEIDPYGTQNFQPLFEGVEPNFRATDEGLYVLDQNNLALLPVY